jgi:formate hydrogenlyase transcriptional activator
MSPRAGRPLVSLNCAALPSGLIESELFGHEKGAFTDASTRQPGRFESADGSTLFLDEVAELPLDAQAKLLRVLEDGRFERLGSAQTVRVDVRVIAATNRDLAAMVDDRRFRPDLFYRLRVFPIEVPPLRARAEDIPLLVWDAVRFFSVRLGKTIDSISWETMQHLQRHSWPGNVRELRNMIERSVILSSGRTLSVAFEPTGAEESPPITLFDAQRRHVLATLEHTGWRIGGRDGAAARLAVRRSTLNSMMKRLGISRPMSLTSK